MSQPQLKEAAYLTAANHASAQQAGEDESSYMERLGNKVAAGILSLGIKASTPGENGQTALQDPVGFYLRLTGDAAQKVFDDSIANLQKHISTVKPYEFEGYNTENLSFFPIVRGINPRIMLKLLLDALEDRQEERQRQNAPIPRKHLEEMDRRINEALYRHTQEDDAYRICIEDPEITGKWAFPLSDDIQVLTENLPENLRTLITDAAKQDLSNDQISEAIAKKIAEQNKALAGALIKAIESDNSKETEFQRDLASGVYLGQTFLQLVGKPKLARKIGGVYAIYNKLNKLIALKNPKTLTLTAGYVGVAMMAVDLLAKSKGDSFESYMQDAVKQLFESLEIIHEKLDTILENQKQILEDLHEIKGMLANIDNTLDVIQQKLEALSEEMNVYFHAGQASRRANDNNKLQASVKKLHRLSRTVDYNNAPVDTVRIIDALDQISEYIQSADDPEFTYYFDSAWNTDVVTRSINGSPGVENQIGLIPAIRAYAGTNVNLIEPMIVNPEVLANAGEGLLLGLTTFPDFTRHNLGEVLEGSTVHDIVVTGQNFLENIHKLFDEETLNALKDKYEILAERVVKKIIDQSYREHKEHHAKIDLYPHKPFWQIMQPDEDTVGWKECENWAHLDQASKHLNPKWPRYILLENGDVFEKNNVGKPSHGTFVTRQYFGDQSPRTPRNLAEMGLLTQRLPDRVQNQTSTVTADNPAEESTLHYHRKAYSIGFHEGPYQGETLRWSEAYIYETQKSYRHDYKDHKTWIRASYAYGGSKLRNQDTGETDTVQDTLSALEIFNQEALRRYGSLKEAFKNKVKDGFDPATAGADNDVKDLFATAACLRFMGALSAYCQGADPAEAKKVVQNKGVLLGSKDSLGRLFDSIIKDAANKTDADGNVIRSKKEDTLGKYVTEEMTRRMKTNLDTFMGVAFPAEEDKKEAYTGPQSLNNTVINLGALMELFTPDQAPGAI